MKNNSVNTVSDFSATLARLPDEGGSSALRGLVGAGNAGEAKSAGTENVNPNASSSGANMLSAADEAPVAPATLAQHLLNQYFIDREQSGLRPLNVEGSGAACSHEAAHMIDGAGNHYRVKSNKYGGAATTQEVLSASVLSLLGFPHTPEARLVTGFQDAAAEPKLRIASKMIPGFRDWGVFLERDAAAFFPEVSEARAAYEAALAKFNSAEADKHRLLQDNPAMSVALSRDAKRALKTVAGSDQWLEPLRQYRDARFAQARAQDTMLSLLPESFKDALVRAFYVSEVVANWDFVNHERANTGWVIPEGASLNEMSGPLVAVSVDFGNSGLNGFKGQDKAGSAHEMARAARFDDPYQAFEKLKLRSISGSASFENISASFGMVGFLPRSSVYAKLLESVIADEARSGSPCPPAAAIEVAYRLSRLPHGTIAKHVDAFFDAGSQHPQQWIRDIFQADHGMGEVWQRRCDAILQRVPEQVMGSWLERNGARAVEIRRELRAGLEASGQRDLHV